MFSGGMAGRGDLGQLFRTQEPRTMEQVDLLLQRQEVLRKLVGEERSAEIRKAPELFADADEFRIYHAKSRFRATFTTIGAAMVASSVGAQMLGFKSGT